MRLCTRVSVGVSCVSTVADEHARHFSALAVLRLPPLVQDTGIGISPAQLATLFKSFSQSVGDSAWQLRHPRMRGRRGISIVLLCV